MLLPYDSFALLDLDNHSIDFPVIPSAWLPITAPEKTLTSTPQPFKPKEAEYCGHYLHPGTPHTQVLCPSCKLKQRLESLQHVTKLWDKRGGPAPEASEKNEFYYQICQAWHAEKACFAKYAHFLDLWAENERQWELENPGLLGTAAVEVKSAGAALGFARRNTPYLQWLDSDAEMGAKTTTTGSQKNVRFVEGIVEWPKRGIECFRRSSTQYSQGRWAAPFGQTWSDTSFFASQTHGNSTLDVSGEDIVGDPKDADEPWKHVAAARERRIAQGEKIGTGKRGTLRAVSVGYVFAPGRARCSGSRSPGT
ncbi:hypothetical protein BU26DRAFT_143163 [Trematosphaeria pertusa]|uniref:Uncharacterized protein n=1 Tax=Trematosphaeria pertusa TaxID=390896 RepID=A0A6A6IXK0_9PLEO|nr:uncharacterized protein BU26DRAFT_143163 [Trematosphaeria pertusa]KAF2254662.1 hypothetical protein BU26DRAFT_143163 [Trematosphaeria pertusa]